MDFRAIIDDDYKLYDDYKFPKRFDFNPRIPGNYGTYRINDFSSFVKDFDLQILSIILNNKLYKQKEGLEALFQCINENLISPNRLYEKVDDEVFILLYKRYKYIWLLPDILKEDENFMYMLENY